ncbi:hypothetical protein DM992_34670 [Burkholderia sp. JP2-270]|uniref:WYL domain-containing protein n=1 Tax=Burkholderia sp. JP2-270 TaxID=2217913 RepID=UPI000DA3727F|nr:hypothetical protein [Burkholderia sp. JP2-270]AWV04529.1 hypothetical protein DM992_34670 [Burkholderia sp. JP2-270]
MKRRSFCAKSPMRCGGSYRIEVKYRSWRGASRRELEPLGLVLKGGAVSSALRDSIWPGTGVTQRAGTLKALYRSGGD